MAIRKGWRIDPLRLRINSVAGSSSGTEGASAAGGPGAGVGSGGLGGGLDGSGLGGGMGGVGAGADGGGNGLSGMDSAGFGGYDSGFASGGWGTEGYGPAQTGGGATLGEREGSLIGNPGGSFNINGVEAPGGIAALGPAVDSALRGEQFSDELNTEMANLFDNLPFESRNLINQELTYASVPGGKKGLGLLGAVVPGIGTMNNVAKGTAALAAALGLNYSGPGPGLGMGSPGNNANGNSVSLPGISVASASPAGVAPGGYNDPYGQPANGLSGRDPFGNGYS